MNNKPKYTPVRLSHLSGYSGVGAIVYNANKQLVTIVDTSHWKNKQGDIIAQDISYVKRVTIALGLGDIQLRMPPIATKDDKQDIIGSALPAVLFPKWTKCKQCNLLHNNPWKDSTVKPEDDIFCTKCHSDLTQVTYCAINNAGYLSEVPWHALCHKNRNQKCEADYQEPYLRLKNSFIECTRCGVKGAYQNQKISFIDKQQPWLYNKTAVIEKDVVHIVEVNNPGVYSPERVNALVIPPESRFSKNATIADYLLSNPTELRQLQDELKSARGPQKTTPLKRLATQYQCSVDDIKEALQKIEAGYSPFNQPITSSGLLLDEYNAFLELLCDVKDTEDFVTQHQTQQWHALNDDKISPKLSVIIGILDKHIVAKRLREIQVFKGFYRGFHIEDDKPRQLVPPDITGDSQWLPAIELFGEGVFFTLNQNLLSRWEGLLSVQDRAKEVRRRYEKSDIQLHQDIIINARFLLLHTLAHLLIRELESTAGYPAASLSERIYCSQGLKMAGILIYTAVPDTVGSLGGIVQSVQPKSLLGLLDGVFKHANWCSLDPICSEHTGQGPGLLNRAACHACLLVPETACDYGNMLLDRVLIKGSNALNIPNFLDFIQEEINGG